MPRMGGLPRLHRCMLVHIAVHLPLRLPAGHRPSHVDPCIKPQQYAIIAARRIMQIAGQQTQRFEADLSLRRQRWIIPHPFQPLPVILIAAEPAGL